MATQSVAGQHGSNVVPFNRFQTKLLSRQCGIDEAAAEYLIEEIANTEAESLRRKLHDDLYRLGYHYIICGDDARKWAMNFLRTHFSVRTIELIPASRLPEALELVGRMRKSATSFCNEMIDVRNAFVKSVIGHGAPWTPSIRRKLGREPGERPDWVALANELKSKTAGVAE